MACENHVNFKLKCLPQTTADDWEKPHPHVASLTGCVGAKRLS